MDQQTETSTPVATDGGVKAQIGELRVRQSSENLPTRKTAREPVSSVIARESSRQHANSPGAPGRLIGGARSQMAVDFSIDCR